MEAKIVSLLAALTIASGGLLGALSAVCFVSAIHAWTTPTLRTKPVWKVNKNKLWESTDGKTATVHCIYMGR